jgi:hypothetical protein
MTAPQIARYGVAFYHATNGAYGGMVSPATLRPATESEAVEIAGRYRAHYSAEYIAVGLDAAGAIVWKEERQ